MANIHEPPSAGEKTGESVKKGSNNGSFQTAVGAIIGVNKLGNVGLRGPR